MLFLILKYLRLFDKKLFVPGDETDSIGEPRIFLGIWLEFQPVVVSTMFILC